MKWCKIYEINDRQVLVTLGRSNSGIPAVIVYVWSEDCVPRIEMKKFQAVFYAEGATEKESKANALKMFDDLTLEETAKIADSIMNAANVYSIG